MPGSIRHSRTQAHRPASGAMGVCSTLHHPTCSKDKQSGGVGDACNFDDGFDYLFKVRRR